MLSSRIAVLRSNKVQSVSIGLRSFSCSPVQHRLKHILPDIVHQDLQDSSNIASKYEGKHKQIFLDPSDIHNNDNFKRVLLSLNKSKAVTRVLRDEYSHDTIPTDETFEVEETSNTLIANIDGLKPDITKVSKAKYKKMAQDLKKSFRRDQLQQYASAKYEEPEHKFIKKSINATKSVLAKRIIEDIWRIKVAEFLSYSEDYLSSKSFKLTKRDLFILLSNNQEALEHIHNCGVNVTFDSNKDIIKFSGSSSQLDNAEINLNSILSSTFTETINFISLKVLLGDKYDEFAKKLVKITDVYFNHIKDEIYEVTSPHYKQLKRFKRLVLWSLGVDKHRHLRKDVFIPQSFIDNIDKLDFLPYKDDMCISWNNRTESLFKLKAPTPANDFQNVSLARDLVKFSNDSLESTNLSFANEFDEVKTLRTTDEEDALSLFKSINVEEEPSTDNVSEDGLKTEEPVSDFNINEVLSDAEIDQLYNTLLDFKYREELKGVERDNLNPPIFVATLGHILFKGEESTKAGIPKKPEISKQNITNLNYGFNTNVEFANSKVLTLPIHDWNDPSISKSNQSLNEDPNTYTIQLQFLPSIPLNNENSDIGEDIDTAVNYPPIEIWIDLNGHKTPDLETFQAVTVEGENDVHIALPSSGSDLKVSCQVSGNLIVEKDPSESLEASTDTETDINVDVNEAEAEAKVDDNVLESHKEMHRLLTSPTDRYSRFNSQPGIGVWLKKSAMNFRGREPISIHPELEMIINGKTVNYNFLSINYRRKLEFDLSDNTMIELNTVEGGELGGRKVEVNFIGDMSQEIDKQQLKTLLSDAIKFIKDM
ncbi:mitochondrial inner-membrane-bound regulator-domain-containing protein [Scheffersomyces amazonensis]|uniref:mitochondrial inner-membrane-bound regulator-domain-containing protein n=1 Tax=Scheffersomyces amazonensis TaxID=1078765 RepID=UPI00315DF540